jgi:hypothetical protein
MINGNAFYQIEAPSPQAAKRVYRQVFGVKKIPSGSVISSDKDNGFFDGQPNWQKLN